jgi:hypothetical protein
MAFLDRAERRSVWALQTDLFFKTADVLTPTPFLLQLARAFSEIPRAAADRVA